MLCQERRGQECDKGWVVRSNNPEEVSMATRKWKSGIQCEHKARRKEQWWDAVRVLESRKWTFSCWKWIAGPGSLRGEESSKRNERRRWRTGGAVEMRVAAPFFTADKNICRDINLELRSSLPPLPHHPSSFRTNHHLGTPPLYHHPPTHKHTEALAFFYSLSQTLKHTSIVPWNIHAQTHAGCEANAQTWV